MFWGVTLDSGKRYTQTVEKSFHLSMAALGFQNCSATPVTVMVEVDKAQFALCTLQPGKIPQQPLDYCFTEGEEITFFSEGPGNVHLTGYLMEEPNALEFEEDDDELTAESEDSSESASGASASESEDDSLDDEITLGHLLQSGDIANNNDDDGDDDEESGDDDWDPSKDNPKRKKRNRKDKMKTKSEEEQTVVTKQKKSKQTEGIQQSVNSISNRLDDDDDDDEDGESWTPEEKVETDYNAKKKAKSKKGANKKKRQNETSESKETHTETPRKKAKKKDEKNKAQREENESILDNNSESCNSVASPANAINSVKSSKHKQHGKQQNQVETPEGSPVKKKTQSQVVETKKRKLPGGVVLEDLKKGDGPVAKNGQKVHVYYKCSLAKNKKQIDACLTGPPFSFKLGAGEVIRGWDLGVAGMQIGGKRRLTVPPSQGYGNQREGPIPPNSTLEFEVQLMRIH